MREHRWMVAALVLGALLLGAAVALPKYGLDIAVGVLLIPVAVLLARRWPEAVLLLFLVAGSYKTVLPSRLDPTLLLGAVVVCLGVLRIARGDVRRPPVGAWAFLAFGLVVLASLSGLPAGYGLDKVVRFTTLGAVAFFAGYLLLDNDVSVERYMRAAIAFGLVVGTIAIAQGSIGDARFTALQSNTIQLGRAASFAAAGAFVSLLHDKNAFVWSAPAMAISLLTLAGTGSRGPALGIILVCGALLVVRLFTAGAARAVIVGAAAGVVIGATGVWALVPVAASSRFALLLSGSPGTSGAARLVLYATAGTLFLARPVAGWGAGAFADYGAGLAYPHNAILEVASEFGVVGLVPYVLSVVSALVASLVRVFSRPSVAGDFLFAAVSIAVVNAMVSGDINDNRILYTLMGAVFAAAVRSRIVPETKSEVSS